MLKVYIIAGETSGDLIGAEIISSLRAKFGKSFAILGIGGTNMQNAGLMSLFSMEEISVMGFFEVLPKVLKIRRLMRRTICEIIEQKPDYIITIDSPGFCFRVVKAVRESKNLKSTKFYHVVAPTVWAYKEHRAKTVAQLYDTQFCILPFEPPYFAKHGMNAKYIGYPPYFRIKNSIKKLAEAESRYTAAQQLESSFYPHDSVNDISLMQNNVDEFIKTDDYSQETLSDDSGVELNANLTDSTNQTSFNLNTIECAKTRENQGIVNGEKINYDINSAVETSGFKDLGISNVEGSLGNNINQLDLREQIRRPLIAITLGSRRGEVLRHMEIIKRVIQIVSKAQDDITFAILATPRFHNFLKERFRSFASVTVESDENTKLRMIQSARFAIAKSGTNAVEIAIIGTPAIVYYNVNFLSHILIKMMVKIKFANIINIIAGREILPEFLQKAPDLIAYKAIELLKNPEMLSTMQNDMIKIVETLKTDTNFADIVVDSISEK
jgi:lipid A disaccharide synthetase